MTGFRRSNFRRSKVFSIRNFEDTSLIRRSKVENNAFKTFDLLKNLLVTSTIMRSKVFKLRMRESYKRSVKTCFFFANPWIRINSKVTHPDLKRFNSYHGSQILIKKNLVCIVIMNPVNFQNILPVFTNPTNLHESLVLWQETNP
jgi:hypothetical protein